MLRRLRCGHVDCGGRNCKNDACGKVWATITAPAYPVPPNGTYTRMAFYTQHTNALAEYFVIYEEDFYQGSDRLNPAGVRHLGGVIRRLPVLDAPVKVEPTGNADLDARRLAAVSARAGRQRFGRVQGGSRRHAG